MKPYFFLATLLPDLRIGEQPEIGLEELDFLFRMNLTSGDYERTRVLKRFFDIENIRLFWLGENLEPHGNYDEKQLDEFLLNREQLPRYIFDFIDHYESIPDRLKNFSELWFRFSRYEIDHASGFLKKYLQFEREMRLVTTAFRAKQLDRDVMLELKDEDPLDPFVIEILAQKDASTYVPPGKYEDLMDVFTEFYHEPLKLHQALTEYRFKKVDQMIECHQFTIDRILGYLVQFVLVERWMALDNEKGLDIIKKMAS